MMAWLKFRNLGLLLSGLLFLQGCSSVPLGTLFKLANFDQNDLSKIKPQQVKVRITINQPAQLKTKNVSLVLVFNYNAKSQHSGKLPLAGLVNSATEYQFELQLVNHKQLKAQSGWLFNQLARFQYEFVIAANSIPEFKKYQREFLKYGKPSQYHWTVYYYLKKRPPMGEKIGLDLELKFSDIEEYFYLLKGAELDIN